MLIGVYALEYVIVSKEKQRQADEGSKVKKNTNAFFLPTSTTGIIVHHQYYSLSYNEAHEQAEWVAYELKKSHLSKNRFERPYFEMDNAVITGSAHWKNYKDSGFDRGHLCPAGDRQFKKLAHDETFLTSNITPQNHDFNAGIWNKLEQQVRYWAKKHDGVFVVTGGVLEDNLESIGSENVSVPNYFYKIVMDYNKDNPKMIAFLLPHNTRNLKFSEFEVTVDSIESITGVDFFKQLNDSLEERLESTLNYDDW